MAGLSLAAASLAAARAHADVFYFSDGEVLEGQVLREDPSEVTIEVTIGRLTVERARIVRVERRPWKRPEALRPPAPAPPPPPPPPAEVVLLPDTTDAERVVAAVLPRLATASAAAKADLEAKLAALGDAGAPALLRAFSDPQNDPDVRIEAAALLARLRGPAIVAAFDAATADANVDVAAEAICSIGALGAKGRPARRTIERILASRAPPLLRTRAARALERLDDPACLPALMGALSADDGDVRVAARLALVSMLSRVEIAPALDALARLARSERLPEGRAEAAACVAALGKGAQEQALLDCVRGDESDLVRAAAVRGLARIATDECRSVLLATMVRDSSPRVRVAACVAARELPEARRAEAIPLLIESLRQADEVARAACESLKLVTGADFPPSYVAWLAWWQEKQRTP